MDGIELEDLVAPDDEDNNKDLTGLEHLLEHQREQLRKLLEDVFNDVPGADFALYHLDTGQHPPVSQVPYRPGLNLKGKVKEAELISSPDEMGYDYAAIPVHGTSLTWS